MIYFTMAVINTFSCYHWDIFHIIIRNLLPLFEDYIYTDCYQWLNRLSRSKLEYHNYCYLELQSLYILRIATTVYNHKRPRIHCYHWDLFYLLIKTCYHHNTSCNHVSHPFKKLKKKLATIEYELKINSVLEQYVKNNNPLIKRKKCLKAKFNLYYTNVFS